MAAESPKKTLFYMPPSDLREPMPNWMPFEYDHKIVRDSLQSVIHTFCVDMGARGRDAYTWSLYAAVGLPDNVLIYDGSMTELIEYLAKDAPLDLSCVNKRPWFAKSPFLFISDVRAFTPQKHELHMRDDRTFPPREDLYKLHASVKHEYILYTVLKLSTLFLDGQRPFQMKCLFNSRYSNITDRNRVAFDMQVNGGSVPSIVIYGGTTLASIRTIYKAAEGLFSAEDRVAMGLMSPGDPTHIPPMNVRLDEIFAYALGDRDQKLTQYGKNTEQGREPVCRLPGWLLARLADCNTDRRDQVVAEMQGWFGRPLCDRMDAEGRFQVRRADGTADPLCYLSLSAADMGSPRNMTGGKHRRYRNRKTRRSKQRKFGGGVTFRNNTKPNINAENYSHLPANYLSNMHNHLQSHYYPVANQHANDAEIFAAVQNSTNDPAEMREALRIIYDPQPLTESEKTVMNMLLTRGIHKGINRVAIAPMSPAMRDRILNHLRYSRAIHKVHHMYEKEHVPHPKYVHAEWNQ